MARHKKPTGNPAKAAKKSAAKTATSTAADQAATPSAMPVIEEGKKAVLHIGCGIYNPDKLPKTFRTPEWQEVRLDIDASVKPDIVASMLDMHMIPDGSVDAIFSSHNIEHLYPHQVPGALKEFRRVLKPGGMFMVTLPDIQTVAAYVAEGIFEEPLYKSPGGTICPIDIFYGWRTPVARGNHFMAHKTGFTAKSLAVHLLNAGFFNVRVSREWVNLWAVGYKLEKNDPKASTKVQLFNIKLEGPEGQKLPIWYLRKLQLMDNPEAKTDELDIPPQHWKPLGL